MKTVMTCNNYKAHTTSLTLNSIYVPGSTCQTMQYMNTEQLSGKTHLHFLEVQELLFAGVVIDVINLVC